MIRKVYKSISFNLFVAIFILMGCNSSIPITIHGVSPEEYFQGKKNLDSAYVASNYPLYDTWHLVAMGDPPQEVINGTHISAHIIHLTLTNQVDSIKPQYLNYRFLYTGSNNRYHFKGIYEFSTAGNIYISDIKYKEYKKQYPTYYSLNGNPTEDETEAWLWNLIISADQYVMNGKFLTFFSGQEVLIFSNRLRTYRGLSR